MARRVNWLNSIRDWQQDFLGSLDAREFVDCVTDELFGKGVLVFTPFGEVMRLPKVSKPYSIDSLYPDAISAYGLGSCLTHCFGVILDSLFWGHA